MRGIMFRALPVCVAAFATGCFLTGSSVGPSAAHNTPTHACWQQVGVILAQKSTGSDMKAVLPLLRDQVQKLGDLPTDNVDPVLVAAVTELVKCEDEVLRQAKMAGDDPAALRVNKEVAQQFAEANRQAIEAKKRLVALRGLLNDRYHGGFSAIEIGGETHHQGHF